MTRQPKVGDTRECRVLSKDGEELQRFTQKFVHGGSGPSAWIPVTEVRLHPGRGEHVQIAGVRGRGPMSYQQSRALETHLTPATRYAKCPACGQMFHTPRRNAMAASSRVRSMVRQHFNETHTDEEVKS